jgi:hypothetical protein
MLSVFLTPKYAMFNPIGEGSIIAFMLIFSALAFLTVFPVHTHLKRTGLLSANTVIS